MDHLGPAGEFLRISEHYRRLTDTELLVLSRQASELTPMAQDALATEISQRGLKVELEEPPKDSVPEPTPLQSESNEADSSEPDPYEEDRQLVQVCTVWSLADAFQVQELLERAGIPFFMGQEKATSADKVTSNFADGVGVGVMSVGVPWAQTALQYYEPANAPEPMVEEAPDEIPVRCPKCHSTEVVFEQLVPAPAAEADRSPPKYKWMCDSCGHEWEDDGIAKE